MNRPFLLVTSFVCLSVPTAAARCVQSSGARGGLVPPPSLSRSERLEHEAVPSYIRIEGRAEVRVKPTDVRVVFAVTSQGKNAATCGQSNRQKRQALVESLLEKGFQRSDLATDFISVLPVYEWVIDEQEGKRVATEKLKHFLMQVNVHVAAKSEDKARLAVRLALEHGITDVIAFDYWSGEIDRHKVDAQTQALTQAKRKAELLLGALFDEKPRPVNVSEETKVVYPRALYEDFQKTYEQVYVPQWNEQIPRIRAARPKNTYYRGLFIDSDTQGKTLPMHPEISVVSSVQLYFHAPEKRWPEKPAGKKKN
ncbi:MAG: SIMPL domain-containing protein [Planctomycetota bacterium]